MGMLPGLGALLNAQREVAKRAVASRLRNAAAKLEVAQGKTRTQEPQ
jgi:hypothetical protein